MACFTGQILCFFVTKGKHQYHFMFGWKSWQWPTV